MYYGPLCVATCTPLAWRTVGATALLIPGEICPVSLEENESIATALHEITQRLDAAERLSDELTAARALRRLQALQAASPAPRCA